ncbi:MAG: hypothetical protein R6V74_10165 [Lutibacter sp.]
MNLGTAIVGAIFIAVFMLPFIFMLNGRKKNEKHLLQSILTIADKHNCKISQKEISEEFAIGLDETLNHLFFFKKTKDKEIVQHIDLKEIKSCKVIKTDHTSGNKEDSYKSIDKLDLHFSFLDRKNPDISLVFYDSEENFGMDGEIQMIEKWREIINNRLKTI